ncbi:MAG TPA: serine hydrolase, partial [Arthrobacter sp.]
MASVAAMEQREPRQSGNPPGSTVFRRPSRAFRRTRTAAVAVCAASLAVALGLGVHSAAQARSTAAAQSGSQTAGQAPASGSASASPGAALPAATPAARAIDAELDAQINAIIDANPDYQLGVALLDLSDGADASREVHQYGVQEAFVAASTAKVLAAEAYYHLVETGEASLDDPLGAYTAEFQLQAMIQQSDNDSWSLIMDAVGYSELTDYASWIGVDYAPTSNTLTPAEMARILAGLYSGTLLEPGNTAQLLGYMQDTNFETLIPAAVP